jgi:hypothetical protein
MLAKFFISNFEIEAIWTGLAAGSITTAVLITGRVTKKLQSL